MPDDTVEWSFLRHQMKFWMADNKIKILSGSIGAGKSLILTRNMIANALKRPGGRGLLTRKDFTDLRVSTLKTFVEQCPKEYVIDHNKQEHLILIETEPYECRDHSGDECPNCGGTGYVQGEPYELYYSGLKSDGKNPVPSGIGSTEFDQIGIDEMTEVTKDDFDFLLGRLRLQTETVDGEPALKQIMGATNPGPPNHWMHERFINPSEEWEDEDSVVFYATTEDNPFLDDDYVTSLKRSYPPGSMMRKRYLQGKWVAAEGLVYDTFDHAVHVKDEEFFLQTRCVVSECTEEVGVETRWCEEHGQFGDNTMEPTLRDYKKIVVGADAGFTNPRALLVIGVTGNDEYHVIDEYYRTRTDIADAIRWLEAKGYDVNRAFHDPSEPSDIEELQKNGFRAEKANNDIIAGISAVHKAMGNFRDDDGERVKPRLFVHPRCTNFLNEVVAYRYPDDDRRDDETPIKEDDHLMDALRYAIMGVKHPEEPDLAFGFA